MRQVTIVGLVILLCVVLLAVAGHYAGLPVGELERVVGLMTWLEGVSGLTPAASADIVIALAITLMCVTTSLLKDTLATLARFVDLIARRFGHPAPNGWMPDLAPMTVGKILGWTVGSLALSMAMVGLFDDQSRYRPQPVPREPEPAGTYVADGVGKS